MLQSFLNRLTQHPILRRDHVVHRFLTGDASWNEVLHSPPISLLPKNILKAPPVDPATAADDQRYMGMLLPKPSGKLRVPDEEDRYFTEMEAAAKEYEQVIGAGLEKVVRRLIKRYSELSKEYESLGGAYNAFSLNENGGSLPLAIERVGQASDALYLSLQDLVTYPTPNTSSPSFPSPHPLRPPTPSLEASSINALSNMLGFGTAILLLRTPRRIKPIRRNPPNSPKIPPPKSPPTRTNNRNPHHQTLNPHNPRKIRTRSSTNRVQPSPNRRPHATTTTTRTKPVCADAHGYFADVAEESE